CAGFGDRRHGRWRWSRFYDPERFEIVSVQGSVHGHYSCDSDCLRDGVDHKQNQGEDSMSSKWQGEQALTLKAAQLAAERPPKPKKDRFLLWMMVLGGLFFIFSVYQLKLNLFVVFEGALTFLQLLTEMFPPSFAQWKHVLPAALESLQVA